MRILCAIMLLRTISAVSPASAHDEVWPESEWRRATPDQAGLSASRLAEAREYALTGKGSGLIVRGGKAVLSWGDQSYKYDLKSSAKSIGASALGLAIQDGKIRLTDRARAHHPSLGIPPKSNEKTGYLDEVTIFHLATQTAGFGKPSGYEPLLFRPGTKWHYSDGGPNWLAECVTLVYRRDLSDLMFERVFLPIGVTPEDLTWRAHRYRPREIAGVARREIGSGIFANVEAMARIGLLYLRRGRWKDRQILPEDFVDAARTTPRETAGLPEHDPSAHENASRHYGLLWWNNNDGTIEGVPRDAYWSWGLYDSLIFVVPSLDLVVARAGESWARPTPGHYDPLKPFLQPIVSSVIRAHVGEKSPYPASETIVGVEWAPASSIVRKALGSDNWPLTWGEADEMYAAYGDGRGFEPGAPRKLSLGLARIDGSPEAFHGINIQDTNIEQVGDGEKGLKASGILMVDGALYLWARNAGLSRPARSLDRGKTWTWADWRFEKGFACPTFLNFGPNYSGAKDGYAYVYSHDSTSAYLPSDRMVMARVPAKRIMDRSAYEFFLGWDSEGIPCWTGAIESRGAVFSRPGLCYRSSITFNAGLGRFLWCQSSPGGAGEDPRYRGGFAVFEGREPWGPWRTVFLTERWDVGPGESSSFPTRWMSEDGAVAAIVFSGNDAFSVRKARFLLGR